MKTIVIGSGPIVIGQAAEFDYSGTQACESLKEAGHEVVLLNSNPATIMTDQAVADRIYIEPMDFDFFVKVLEKERPKAILASMGGQTGLNLLMEASEKGILSKYGIEVLGTSVEGIQRGEDRELFRKAMEDLGEPVIASAVVENLEEGKKVAARIGYPVVVRPAYTLGGSGGGFAQNAEELEEILNKGLSLSRVGQVLIEKSILGWREIEFEMIRDAEGTAICVCHMENIDPVGVHTGDSIVVAPCQSLSEKEVALLKAAAHRIVEEIGIVGGCNVQFALHPSSMEYAIIEINPRLSRSSALASKATGYPIARVATELALGQRLWEIPNELTPSMTAAQEVCVDYVVVKIPKWPFDKFKGADRHLGTKMMATGEVMAIGQNFEAALLKGLRGLEIGCLHLEHPTVKQMSMEALKKEVVRPSDERLFVLAEMLRRGYQKRALEKLTGISAFFMEKLEWIVRQEEELKGYEMEDLRAEKLANLKKKGFSDAGIAACMGLEEEDIVAKRREYGIKARYKKVDACAGALPSESNYFYSSYEGCDEVESQAGRKIVVLGSGPIRIGQGIEFDYCSVHALKSLKKLGITSIMINNNPETVSTDFTVADRLYFEALVREDVLNILEKEQPEGVILQFGGQTAIKLAQDIAAAGFKILGTTADCMDAAEDRERFEAILEELEIKRPKGEAVWSKEEGERVAQKIGYPVLVRPSYVLGGQGMEICHEEKGLVKYLKASFERDAKSPVLIDKYLNGMELEVDAISDGEEVFIPGIMEHLERAGVHSGDSISIYPPQHLYEGTEEKILDICRKLAKALDIRGMMNIQFIAYQGEIYVIEVNPRSSRTVPYISKITGVPVIEVASRVMLGESLRELGYLGIEEAKGMVAVKVPVFSTEKLQKVEVSLGPEMRSTGEVLGLGKSVEEAIFKGLRAAKRLHSLKEKKILVTLKDKDKEEFLPLAKKLQERKSKLYATQGTAKYLKEHGIEATKLRKLSEPSPNLLDSIKGGEIDLMINTPTKANDAQREGFKLRRQAIEYGVEVLTSLDTVAAILAMEDKGMEREKVEIYDISRI